MALRSFCRPVGARTLPALQRGSLHLARRTCANQTSGTPPLDAQYAQLEFERGVSLLDDGNVVGAIGAFQV